MMQLETFFTVPEQTRLLIFAVLLGIPLGVVFDVLRTLRLLPPQHPLQLPCQMVKLFFFIRFEQVVERMHRKGIPHILRRGCHKHDQQVRVGRTQPLRRLNAIGALHADVQKHHLIPFAPAGPQKFISAGKTAAGYVLIFKCLFQQLFQPFGIRLAVFYDRRLQVHCCTPCSFHVLILIL